MECKLEAQVKALIELICDVRKMEETVIEMKYDAQKAPLGKLTTEQIKAGYLALRHIDDLIQRSKYSQKDLVQACNDFYTRLDILIHCRLITFITDLYGLFHVF